MSLYISVERNGKPVTGLTAENFRVSEDGKPVAFRLEPVDGPDEIVLVVESSQGSYRYAEDINTIMQGFDDAAAEGDWYALVSFSHEAGVDQDFTRDKTAITSTWASLSQPAWNDINTYDAVYRVLDALQRLPGRRAVVVIGSGYDTYSDHIATDVEKLAESSNVLVYSIGTGTNVPGAFSAFGNDFDHMHRLQGEAFLDRIAKQSGGLALFPESQDELEQALKSVFDDFKSRYRLVYDQDPPADGKLHKVKVEVENSGRGKLKVHVRKGWRSE